MEESQVVKALAALAQPVRLQLFRALVVTGSQGLTPGTMAEGLGISASSLSFHLKELVHAGLRALQPQPHLPRRVRAHERLARLPDAELLRRGGVRDQPNGSLPGAGAAMSTGRKLFAELLGTAFLLAIVIGSGIMGERLADGNVALALVVNTLSTVGGLYVLIEVFGPISGAHFNPAVSAVLASRRLLPPALLPGYVAAQLAGAVLGAWIAHAMFDASILQVSTKVRSGPGQWVAEVVATTGLLLVILRAPAARVAAMVAAYIGSAYLFTASTSFANPAAALGRMFTDTFAGIAPASVPAFVAAQLVGAGLAAAIAHAFDGAPVAPQVEAEPHA
jgi:glycerol uptake facilitator-like aquaporin